MDDADDTEGAHESFNTYKDPTMYLYAAFGDEKECEGDDGNGKELETLNYAGFDGMDSNYEVSAEDAAQGNYASFEEEQQHDNYASFEEEQQHDNYASFEEEQEQQSNYASFEEEQEQQSNYASFDKEQQHENYASFEEGQEEQHGYGPVKDDDEFSTKARNIQYSSFDDFTLYARAVRGHESSTKTVNSFKKTLSRSSSSSYDLFVQETLSTYSTEKSSESDKAGDTFFDVNFETGYDEEFQQLLSVLRKDDSVYAKSQVYSNLATLVNDFVHASTLYAKIIISEKHLPVERKTIKPVSVGGFAGGEKFVAGNCFFRFPLDVHTIYGSEEISLKEANHQMKGLIGFYSAIFAENLDDLYLPLMTTIKYRGFKLVAMSILPIKGDKTLCFGSSNAGKRFAKTDVKAESMMNKVGETLNLASHPILSGKMSTMPTDIEVHHVSDRYYVLDFARVFPPQPPGRELTRLLGNRREIPNERGGHLSFLLRPELLQQYSKPLSSDAFTRFAASSSGRNQYNVDVIDATRYLFEKVIPKAVAHFENMTMTLRNNRKKDCESLVDTLHSFGVNMRFLGMTLQYASKPETKRLILTEGVARVTKAIIRGGMRSAVRNNVVRAAVISPYVENAVSCLNLVFGRTTCTATDESDENCSHLPRCSCCSSEDNVDVFQRSPLYNVSAVGKGGGDTGDVTSRYAKETHRRAFFCNRLKQFLEERFFFEKKDVMASLVEIEKHQSDSKRCVCKCCNCLFKRALDPAFLFLRVQEMLGIELNPTTQENLRFALSLQASVVNIPKPIFNEMDLASNNHTTNAPVSMFELMDPFEVGDVVELHGTTTALPILNLTQGVDCLTRARAKKTECQDREALRLSQMALDFFHESLKRSFGMSETLALCARGLLLSEMSKWEIPGFQSKDAFMDFLQAARISPKHSRTWYYIGQHIYQNYLTQGKNGESCLPLLLLLDELIQSLHIDKDFIKVSLKQKKDPYKGMVYQRVDFCFRRALHLDPNMVNTYKDYANFMLHSMRRPKEAHNLFLRALEIDPRHARTLQNLAKMLQEEKKWSEAMMVVEKNFEVDPENAILGLELVVCMLNTFLHQYKQTTSNKMKSVGKNKEKKKTNKKHQGDDIYDQEAQQQRQQHQQQQQLEQEQQQVPLGDAVLKNARKIYEETTSMMLRHFFTDQELGIRNPRFLNGMGADVMAQMNFRASKNFLKIGRGLWDILETVQFDQTTKDDLCEWIETVHEWAERMLLKDGSFISYHNQMVHNKTLFNQIMQFKKQLVTIYLSIGTFHCSTVVPGCSFASSIPYKTEADVLGLVEQQKLATVLKKDFEYDATPIMKAAAAFEKALEMEKRSISAATAVYCQFKQTFFKPGK